MDHRTWLKIKEKSLMSKTLLLLFLEINLGQLKTITTKPLSQIFGVVTQLKTPTPFKIYDRECTWPRSTLRQALLTPRCPLQQSLLANQSSTRHSFLGHSPEMSHFASRFASLVMQIAGNAQKLNYSVIPIILFYRSKQVMCFFPCNSHV